MSENIIIVVSVMTFGAPFVLMAVGSAMYNLGFAITKFCDRRKATR